MAGLVVPKAWRANCSRVRPTLTMLMVWAIANLPVRVRMKPQVTSARMPLALKQELNALCANR